MYLFFGRDLFFLDIQRKMTAEEPSLREHMQVIRRETERTVE